MSTRRKWINRLLLSVLVLWIFFWKWHTYSEPIERDIATYSVIASEMLHGKHLYSDLWDHKPPAVYATYAAFQFVFGQNDFALFLLWMAATLLSFAGLYRIGLALSGRREIGLAACVFWAFTCANLYQQANFPNTEIFINACLIWAFYLLIRPWELLQLNETAGPSRRDGPTQLAIGLLLALSSMYKHVVVGTAGCLALAVIAFPPPAPRARRKALAGVAIWLGCGVASWLVLLIYMALTGRLRIFVETVFLFNADYAGSLSQNILQSVLPHNLLARPMWILWPLLLLGLAGFVQALRRWPVRPLWFYYLAFLLGSHLALALPGKAFAHYYQLDLPAAIIGAAWALDELSRERTSHAARLAIGAGLMALLLPFGMAMSSLALSPDEWSAQLYSEVFIQAKQLGLRLNHVLEPNETFAQFGNDPELYYYARRRPPTGVLMLSHMLEGPLAAQMADKTVRELDRQKPRILVAKAAQLRSAGSDTAYTRWVRRNYLRAQDQPVVGWFLLMVREDLADSLVIR